MDKTSFIDYDTQKQINAPLNGTLIHGTHRMCDLIPAMLEAIRDTAEYAQLSSRLPSVVTDPSASEWDDRWQDEDISYLHEELTDILERYAPEGYYFGAHPGDGSDFGYWRDESYMLQVISESVKEGQTLVLAEDPAITYRPSHPSEPSIINAYQLARRKEGVMVGNKTHMVNINDLDEDSVEKLFEAVKNTKAKSLTAKEAVKELLPNSGIDFIQNSGTTYDIDLQGSMAKVSGVNVRNDEVFLYGIIKKGDGGIQHLNYLEDLPVPAQNQLVQHVKDTLAKINSPEQSKASTLTPIEKEVIGSIVRGHDNLPDKMEGEDYDALLLEVIDAEIRIKNLQPVSDRQREILIEDSKRYEGGIEEFAEELGVDPDYLKASLESSQMQRQLLQERFDAFKAEHGEEPLYAEVNIMFKGEPAELALIKLSSDVDPRDDKYVFFNATGIDDLKRLLEPGNGEDFFITDVKNITFQPKSLYLGQEESRSLHPIVEALLAQIRGGQASVSRDNADGRYFLTVYDRDRSLGYERGFKDVTVGEDMPDTVYIGHDYDNAVSAVKVPADVASRLLEFAKSEMMTTDIEKQLVELVGKGQQMRLSEPVIINTDERIAKDIVNAISVGDDGSIELHGFRTDEAGIRADFNLEGREDYTLSDLSKVLYAVKYLQEHESLRQKISSICSAYGAEHGEGTPLDCTVGSADLIMGEDEAQGLSDAEKPQVTSVFQDKEGIVWANIGNYQESVELDRLTTSDLKAILGFLEAEYHYKALGKGDAGIDDYKSQILKEKGDFISQMRAGTPGNVESGNRPYTITIGTDNRPGGVKGEYHLQFKPDIMNVTFGEQEDIAREFGGTMRVTDGQEWADFYREDDAVRFADKVIALNAERIVSVRENAAEERRSQLRALLGEVIGTHGQSVDIRPTRIGDRTEVRSLANNNGTILYDGMEDGSPVMNHILDIDHLSVASAQFLMNGINSVQREAGVTADNELREARGYLTDVISQALDEMDGHIEIEHTELPSVPMKGDWKDEGNGHVFMEVIEGDQNIRDAVFYDVHAEEYTLDEVIGKLGLSEARALTMAVREAQIENLLDEDEVIDFDKDITLEGMDKLYAEIKEKHQKEVIKESPVTLDGDGLEVGMKVIWNDPESQYRDPDRIYTIDKINGEVISISDEHSEVEVGASELSVVTPQVKEEADADRDKFLNYVIYGERRYPVFQNLEARLNAFMKAFDVEVPISNTLYGTNSKSGRWNDLHQTASRAIESILRASGNGDEKLLNSTTADYVSDKAKNLAKAMLRSIYDDEMSYKAHREEALKAVGYPYDHSKRADGSYNIPTVDKSLYWEYAAGLITVKDAAREFCRCGWTNFVDEKYTLKKFGEINKEFGKLDADLKPLVKQSQTEGLSNVRFPEAYLRSFAVRLFGNNVTMNLRSYPEVDRVSLGDMPDTITIDGIEIRDGKLKLLSDDLRDEIAQENLNGEELSRITAMLKEAHTAYEKTQKAGEAEDRRPLIKVMYDEGLSKYRGRDLFLGDNGRYFTRQPEGALSYVDNGKVIKDNWKWVICTDNYQLEPDYDYDKYARFEIVDSLDEKKEEGEQQTESRKTPDITVGIRESLETLIRRMMPEPDGTITLPELYDGEAPELGRIGGTFHYVNGEIFLSVNGREDALKDIDGFNELTEPYRLLLEKDITNMLGKNGRIDFVPGTFIDGVYEISSIVIKDGKAMPTGKRDGWQANSFDNISYVGLDELDTAVRAELTEAKGNLRSILDDTKADLGNTYKISPLDIDMGNWKAHVNTIEYNPEFGLDYYVASGIDKDGGHSNVQIHKLDNMSSVCELTKAVREVFVGYHEQKAMHAIHDRITNTWQRSFTPDQVEALNRYHQVAAPDTPAGEVFKELLKEVAQEPDVARKPEKWVTDTAKELDGLAEGITREESRGLHK